MATFAIILRAPNDAVEQRLAENYPDLDQIKFSPTTYLLTGDLLVADICDTLGMGAGEDADAAGIVLRLNGTYYGRARQEVWDWLARATTP